MAHYKGDVRILLKKFVPLIPATADKKVDFDKANEVIDKAIQKQIK